MARYLSLYKIVAILGLLTGISYNTPVHAASYGETDPSKLAEIMYDALYWGLSAGGNVASKRAGQLLSSEVFKLDRTQPIWSVFMLNIKHIINAILQEFFAFYFLSFLKETQQRRNLSPLRNQFYGAGNNILIVYEFFELLGKAIQDWHAKHPPQSSFQQDLQEIDAFLEYRLKHDLFFLMNNRTSTPLPSPRPTKQAESITAYTMRTINSFSRDPIGFLLGVLFFTISWKGNVFGKDLALIFRNDILIPLTGGAGKSINANKVLNEAKNLFEVEPFDKIIDTIINYTFAQFIKYHVFNWANDLFTYLGWEQLKTHFSFCDILYRAADKGPAALRNVNFNKAAVSMLYDHLKQPSTAAAA